MHEAFVSYSVEKLREYDSRIDTCLRKLTDEQIWKRESEEENSLGNLVLHLCGNLSEWVLQALGGEAPSRDRDAEFNAREGNGCEELLARLHSTVERSVAVIEGLSADRLMEQVHIQRHHLPVLHAVYHVVEHFSQHTGQIMFATKSMTSEALGFFKHSKQPQASAKSL